MNGMVTAAMLYDSVACPHRVTMDLYGDVSKRAPHNPFVQMLWEKGSLFERETIATLNIPFLDLTEFSGDEKERRTLYAMDRGEQLIYGGRISADDLLGMPDLLRREGGGYIAGDIKSGAGEEGSEDSSKPKKHYAVQLALYTDILERLGRSPGRRAFVWDVHGKEVVYDFTVPMGKRDPKTLWQVYREHLELSQAILGSANETSPALCSDCKLCHWHTVCRERLKQNNDLTLLPELGRSRRDAMISEIPDVVSLATLDPEEFINGNKTPFHRIGADLLRKFHDRAILLSTPNAQAYRTGPINLPDHEFELFFDIEVDPMRDICYLHGFVERHNGDSSTEEKFVCFFAKETSPEGEKEAFKTAWEYINSRRPCAIYYYSPYEETNYKKLQVKYPDICSAEDVIELFSATDVIDLYHGVVRRSTEWPTNDYSIKTLAKFLGFSWRDVDPSGAASIEWYDQWVRTGDPDVRQRILDYNEDDCRATRVLLDGIRLLA